MSWIKVSEKDGEALWNQPKVIQIEKDGMTLTAIGITPRYKPFVKMIQTWESPESPMVFEYFRWEEDGK